jgi:hypothetical protein
MRKSFSCFDLIPHDQPCNIHKKMALANEIMASAPGFSRFDRDDNPQPQGD